MTNGFEALGLDDALVEQLHTLGYRRPTALQREAVPVVARGTALVGAAGSGSGKTAAYGLGLTLRLDPAEPALQALVLRPDDASAAATAESLQRLLALRDLTVAVARTEGAEGPFPAQVAVASPRAALAALQTSTIKLEALRSLIVDGASEMLALGAAEPLETLIGQVPRDAGRVVLASQLDAELQDWVERHARRARRLADVPADVAPLGARAEYHAGPRAAWLPILTATIDNAAAKGRERVLLYCRRPAEAEELARRLHVRGFALAEGDEPGIRVTAEPVAAGGGLSVSWGVPPDIEALRARAADADAVIIFCEPRELSHLRRLAEALELGLDALRTPPPSDTSRSIQGTRDQLREAIGERDLEPYLLLLEPLLVDHTALQLAAAATALLRERTPEPEETALPAWTRLYIGAGRKDGVRPGHLVGAITGEAPVSGDQIGRIEIRDTYSVVDVAAGVADQVIRSLKTTTIRGRPANARVYRE